MEAGKSVLIEQVRTMVRESGNPEGFAAEVWLIDWLDRPCPALGHAIPIDLLDTPEGLARVSQILAQMQSGAYG